MVKIIAGTLKNRSIEAPKGDVTRPTSSRLRGALFNICQNEIEGASFLDLFAGSGAMGFEALSRGAKSATFVEIDKGAIHCMKKTIDLLHLKESTAVMQGDVLQTLDRFIRLGKQFDIIYADPPYEHKDTNEILKLIDQTDLLKSGGTFFLEEGSKVELDIESLSRLKLVSKRACGQSALFEFT